MFHSNYFCIPIWHSGEMTYCTGRDGEIFESEKWYIEICILMFQGIRIDNLRSSIQWGPSLGLEDDQHSDLDGSYVILIMGCEPEDGWQGDGGTLGALNDPRTISNRLVERGVTLTQDRIPLRPGIGTWAGKWVSKSWCFCYTKLNQRQM